MTIWIEAPFDSLPLEGYRKQRYWLMAEAFAAAGHKVVYWTSNFSHANKAARKFVRETERMPFRLELVATRPYSKNLSFARIRSHIAYGDEWWRRALAEVEADWRNVPDLIIVSLPPVTTGMTAIVLAYRLRAKLVVDVQDAWPETFYRLLPRGLRWVNRMILWPIRCCSRRVYRKADLVTGTCDRYAELVAAAGAKNYYRAYLGAEAATVAREEHGTDEIRLVYVGNMGKSYDLRTVVAGVRKLNAEPGVRVTLAVAGFGGEPESDEAVRFHGMLGRTELAKLLASCDIGIIPMREDSCVGVPNKLGEYTAAGLRVVSSLAGETAQLIERFGCGVTYVAGDADSFAAAVRKAATLPASAAAELHLRELSAASIYRDYVRKVMMSLWNWRKLRR